MREIIATVRCLVQGGACEFREVIGPALHAWVAWAALR